MFQPDFSYFLTHAYANIVYTGTRVHTGLLYTRGHGETLYTVGHEYKPWDFLFGIDNISEVESEILSIPNKKSHGLYTRVPPKF
jgi:hypothetical protein